MTEDSATNAISQEYELPHPPAKVWRALTEPALLEQWLMPNDIQPVVGRSFAFRMEPSAWWDGIVNCEVLEVEEQRRLSYTWCGGPASSPLDTVVTFTLTPTPSGGTRLLLEHSGFVPANAFALQGATQGWQQNIQNRMAAVLTTL